MNTECVVTVVNAGQRFWLKGTTWTFDKSRAHKFADTAAANAAIERASKFNKKAVMKRAEVWSVEMMDKE
jgi:hypothetical protein